MEYRDGTTGSQIAPVPFLTAARNRVSMTKNFVPTHKLQGSQWTRSSPAVGGRHFQVIRLVGAGKTPWRRLHLEAVLTGRFIEVERDELKDPERWSPGWLQFPDQDCDSTG